MVARADLEKWRIGENDFDQASSNCPFIARTEAVFMEKEKLVFIQEYSRWGNYFAEICSREFACLVHWKESRIIGRIGEIRGSVTCSSFGLHPQWVEDPLSGSSSWKHHSGTEWIHQVNRYHPNQTIPAWENPISVGNLSFCLLSRIIIWPLKWLSRTRKSLSQQIGGVWGCYSQRSRQQTEI